MELKKNALALYRDTGPLSVLQKLVKNPANWWEYGMLAIYRATKNKSIQWQAEPSELQIQLPSPLATLPGRPHECAKTAVLLHSPP